MKILKQVPTEVALCTKYKKRYEMEVVSFKGQVNEHVPNILTKSLLCPACGDIHTVEYKSV